MRTEVGGFYRFKGIGRHWTVYAQQVDGLFFSGSCDPEHTIGALYSNTRAGSFKNDNSWERLI